MRLYTIPIEEPNGTYEVDLAYQPQSESPIQCVACRKNGIDVEKLPHQRILKAILNHTGVYEDD